MNARDSMAALHLRVGWTYALLLQQREPLQATALQSDLLVRAYRFGMRAQSMALHTAPVSISDNPELLAAWCDGHDDGARGAHAPACDCNDRSCIHRRTRVALGAHHHSDKEVV